MNQYEHAKKHLKEKPKVWLITGVAGFIGSNLLESLLKLGQKVVGVDNFSTGFMYNLDQVRDSVGSKYWSNFEFVEGDIVDSELCERLTENVNYVLHQAALGSIPRSIDNPLQTNAANITGFLNVLNASRVAQVENFVYAASSSTYGDHPTQPRREDVIGRPLSPYAVTKYVNELYADVFFKSYQFNSIGLRYFNVFGPRQNPQGSYAAVIPKWIFAMLDNAEIVINGDGETSRDFCFIDNVIQANILAATAQPFALNKIYNVALGKRTSLLELYAEIVDSLSKKSIHYQKTAVHREFRKGDIKHSQADISKIKQQLSYSPKVELKEGLDKMLPWIIEAHSKNKRTSKRDVCHEFTGTAK